MLGAFTFANNTKIKKIKKQLILDIKVWYNYRVLQLKAPIVYRLGHEVFILKSGVRLPVGAPVRVDQARVAELADAPA